MVESPQELTSLMTRVRLGDADALEQLLHRYEKEVRLAARVLLGRPLRSLLDSTDLIQSVYGALLTGFREDKFSVTNQQQLIGLAITMVRHKVAHHWRRERRQQPFDRIEAAETEGVAVLRTVPSDSAADPARVAEYNDTVERVCSQLSETERHLVEMRLQGYSTAEVARRLGLNADVLRVRLSRLRRRLRESNLLTEWL